MNEIHCTKQIILNIAMQLAIVTSTILIFYIEKIRSNPIVYGFTRAIEPEQGAFPFQASLMQLLGDGKSYHSFCGGSLIHPKWILTAAHCIQLSSDTAAIKPEEVYVALGSIYRSANGAQILRAKRLIIHQRYLDTDRHDIGLIELRTSAKIGKNVRIVKLHLNKNETLLNTTVYLTGFGIINDFYKTPIRLRKAVLHVNKYDKCFNDPQYSNIEICATSNLKEGKACKGDSGGPLTMLKNKRYVQVGITSHLALLPFCQIGFNHSVYTKIAAYIAWISRMTRINFYKYNK